MDLHELKVETKPKDLVSLLGSLLGGLHHPSSPRISQCLRKRVRRVVLFGGHSMLTMTGVGSAFFSLLASMMIPANLPVQLFIFVSADQYE
jgi:hypothetical protein